MRTLPSPDRASARVDLETAVDVYQWKGSQYGYPATGAELDSVVSLYDAYDLALGSPSEALKGPLLQTDLKNALHRGYGFTQVGSKLESIRVAVMKDVRLCPICGISRPKELDHFLPKDIYRPLAVYVRNLIPLCHDCNHSKGTHVGAAIGEQFVHPYLEALPDVQFLKASIDLSGDALNVDFVIDPSVALPAALAERLAFQIDRLKLNDRYRHELNTYLVSQSTALADAFDAGDATGVTEYLQRQSAAEYRAFHRNHWRPVLLSALAANVEFCSGGFLTLIV